MTDIQKFEADARRVLKHDRAEHGGADPRRSSATVAELFERTAPGLGSLPHEIAAYWMRTYIEQSAAPEDEPTEVHIQWLAAALSLLYGTPEDTHLFTQADWQELKELVRCEAPDIPLETLSQLMSLFLEHGAL